MFGRSSKEVFLCEVINKKNILFALFVENYLIRDPYKGVGLLSTMKAISGLPWVLLESSVI